MRPYETESGVFETEHHLLGADERAGMLAEGHEFDARGNERGEFFAVGIVEIDCRHLRRAAERAVEEPGFHLEVGVERLVVVEMVAREIGEDRGAKMQAEHALLVDAVRTHFHDRLPAAVVAHLREHAVDVERLGRGLERRHGAGAEIVVDRAEQADALGAVEKVL